MGLVHQALRVWQDLSVRLALLFLPMTGVYIAAGFCLTVVLVVLWRLGVFGKRWMRVAGAVLMVGVVGGIIAQAALAKARANYLLRTADLRIASIRKAPVQLKVVDAEGNPVAGASVSIEQLRHSFLFGCNAFRFYIHPGEQNQVYADRFSALFNYATLPFYWGMREPQKGDTRVDDQKHFGLAEWLQTNHIVSSSA
jgi:hypothetical protein